MSIWVKQSNTVMPCALRFLLRKHAVAGNQSLFPVVRDGNYELSIVTFEGTHGGARLDVKFCSMGRLCRNYVDVD